MQLARGWERWGEWEGGHKGRRFSKLLYRRLPSWAGVEHARRAAVLETPEINYTLVGDPGVFLQGLALAADWLCNGQVERCLVVGAEESEWLAVDAFRLSAPAIVLSEGAGAIYLSCERNGLGVE